MSVPLNNAARDRKINYIEFTTTNVAKSKEFYSKAFGWSFQDWGPDYASFTAPEAGIDGGFRTGPMQDASHADGPLVVLYAGDLGAVENAIQAAGGTITVPVFSFPGGRRFHFSDGAGNQLAVWSE
jgi:predicted enzyme related to lactoylglutathione lyase